MLRAAGPDLPGILHHVIIRGIKPRKIFGLPIGIAALSEIIERRGPNAAMPEAKQPHI